MKSVFSMLFLALLFQSRAQGKVLQVPDQCLNQKKAPCLTKIVDQRELVSLSENFYLFNKDSIIQWDSFSGPLELTMLQGNLHILKISQPFKMNQITLSEPDLMVQLKERTINILDLHTFLLSTYTLNSVQTNNVLEKSQFLEKADLIPYMAQFFDQKKDFTEFLNSIAARWKSQLSTQAAIQTNVLKRAIASDENALKKQQLAQYKLNNAQKKVREEFFYRTFYR